MRPGSGAAFCPTTLGSLQSQGYFLISQALGCPQMGPQCGGLGGAGGVFADGVNGFDQKGKKAGSCGIQGFETWQPGHVEGS